MEVGKGIRLGDVVTAGAAATTLAAGVVGWIDWLTVPSDHPVRRPATIHGRTPRSTGGAGASARRPAVASLGGGVIANFPRGF
jgi:hypothetical protein